MVKIHFSRTRWLEWGGSNLFEGWLKWVRPSFLSTEKVARVGSKCWWVPDSRLEWPPTFSSVLRGDIFDVIVSTTKN